MKFTKVYSTQIKVGLLKILYVSFYSGIRIRLHLILGRLNLRKKSKYLYDFYESKRKIMHMGELTDDILNEWKNYNKSLLTPVLKRTIKKTEINDKIVKNCKSLSTKYSKQQRVAGVVDELLTNKILNIKTIAHIGARIDTLSSYFSNKYKKATFHSIDLQENLKELNGQLAKRKNWKVHDGYALKLFKQKKIKPDLVIMLSTSPKFNNKELYEYIKTFKNLGVKALLFFEPWWALPFSFNTIMIKKPENLKNNFSPIGGMTADYHHNYFMALEKNGFSVTDSKITDYEEEKHYHDLFLLAINNEYIQ